MVQDQLINKPKVIMSFCTFDNWINDFDIKIDRLIADCDKEYPIDINVIFPASFYERVLAFGIEYVMEIMMFLYIEKHNGHPESDLLIEFQGEK